MAEDYEPDEVVIYHIPLTEDHIRELRQTGEITCEFGVDGDEGEADRVEVKVETDSGSDYRVDDLLE